MYAKNFLFLHLFLLIHNFIFCTSIDILTFNQTIREGNVLISKENKFVLGFFSPGNSTNRYLGIWYYKVPLQTVVWVANRNHPINGSSSGILFINQHGNLVLYDQQVQIWSTDVSIDFEIGSCEARLLDSGNFVLVQGKKSRRILWESFDYPTNTLLPGMKIGVNWITGANLSLISWRSPDDPGIGDFTVKLDPTGSPQFFLYTNSKPLWRGPPWPWIKGKNIYNHSLIYNHDKIYFSYEHDDNYVLVRLLVSESGILSWLSWHGATGQWKEFWSASNYRCDGYARCGDNGKCNPNYVHVFECSCLPGYEPKFQRNWNMASDASGGCVRKRLKASPACQVEEGFVKVAKVKIPDISNAVWVNMSMDHMECELNCKKNCSCSAYASINFPEKGTKGCWVWYGDLIDVVDLFDDSGYDIYVRVDALELAEIMGPDGFLQMKGNLIILIVVSLSSAWLVISICAYLWLRNRKKRVRSRMTQRLVEPISISDYRKETFEMRNHPDLVSFDINTILTSTNNFSPAKKIGCGGFGSVYKGHLTSGKEVAIKRLSKNSGQGVEEFKNEALLIAKLQHRNLVKLLGFCIHKKERILIYEYLPNCSLDLFLFDATKRSFLNWPKRFEIIAGIARGILYLHQDSRLRIIHRDLKSSNILLDAEMNPKISDFGMARLFKYDQIQDKTDRVVGTYGYMSPEYAVFGKFSVKSDVFSFGVILLEIISGRRSNGFNVEDHNLSLIGHVWELWREERALEIVDSSVAGNYDPEEARKYIQIGLLCVQEDAVDRPTMSAIVLMLNGEKALPSPEQPAYVFRTSSNVNSFTNSRSRLNDGSCSVNQLSITGVDIR